MRRRILASVGGKPLPYDAEVEWIGSSGAYVNSGYIPTKDFRIEFKAYINPLSGWIGSVTENTYNAQQTQYFLSLGLPNNVNGFRSVVFSNGTAAEFNLPSDRIVEGYFDLQKTVVNGISKSNSRVGDHGITEMRVGARCSLYYLRIFDAGIPVRDYKPVVKDGVGCLYDGVTGTVFNYNGDVEVGPIKDGQYT